MKKMLVILAAIVLSAGAATAQTTTPSPAGRHGMHQGRMKHDKMTPEQRANKMTQRLSQQVTLTAAQTTQVQALSLAHQQEMEAIRAKHTASTDRKAAMPEMKAAKQKYEAQLQALLTPEQAAKYQQMHDEQVQKRKEKMKDGKIKMKTQS